MGLQEMPTRPASLFLLGLNQLFHLIGKRKNIIDNVFSKFFKDCDTKEGWKKISDIIYPHNSMKYMPTGSSPSKDARTTDGQSTPFGIDKAPGSIVNIYDTLVEKDLFINTDIKEKMKYELDNSTRELEAICAMRMWEVVLYAYESIYEIEQKAELLNIAMTSLLNSKSWLGKNNPITKSPAQLFFFGDIYTNGSIMASWPDLSDSTPAAPRPGMDYYILANYEDMANHPSGNRQMPSEVSGSTDNYGPISCKQVPWESITEIFSDIIPILQGDLSDIWYIDDIPKITYTYGHEINGTINTTSDFQKVDGIPSGAFNIDVIIHQTVPSNAPDTLDPDQALPWQRPNVSAYFYDGFIVKKLKEPWNTAQYTVHFDVFVRE